MDKIIPTKVAGEVTLKDLLLAGTYKYASERALTPIVGNGTIVSGLVKIAGGELLGKKVPMVGKYVHMGSIIDGTEDIVNAVVKVATGQADLNSALGLGNVALPFIGGGASNSNADMISVI